MFRGVCLVNLKMEPWYHKTTEEIALRNCLTYRCSFTNLCPAHCDLMNYSTSGFSVLHYLPEFAQIHVHWVGDAIQPSHPLLPPFPPAFNLSQHQGLFQSIGASASVLPMNIQGWLPLGLTGLISLSLRVWLFKRHHALGLQKGYLYSPLQICQFGSRIALGNFLTFFPLW